jgi:hypothetical protein
MSGTKANPKPPRDQDASFLEADIISNLKLAADFADLAIRHSEIFDSEGFRYSTDRFLDHARVCSDKLKRLRSLDEKPKA